MNNTREIDYDEGRETPVAAACANCDAKESNGAYLSEYTLPENITLLLCDDCIAEQQLVERVANYLTERPSCETRQHLIDAAKTTQQLVNALHAHDMTACASCAAVPMAACDDCGKLVPAAQLTHNEQFQLNYCSACELRALRHQAIVERHNAEMRRVA